MYLNVLNATVLRHARTLALERFKLTRRRKSIFKCITEYNIFIVINNMVLNNKKKSIDLKLIAVV